MYFHRRMVWVVCVLFSLGLLSNCDMLFFGTEYAPRSIAVSVDDNIKASPNMKMKMKMKSSVGLYSDSAVWFVVAVTPKGEKTMATTTDQLNYVLTLYTDLRYALYFGYILGNETNIQPMRFFDGQSSFKMSKGLNKDASQINLGKLTVSSNGTLTLDKTPEAFIDSDKDGIIDSDDPDDDNDGISDVMDLDSDNDGVSDFFALVDRDMNGYPDILEKTATDTDNNGIPDIVEKKSFATATNTKNSDYYYLTSLITADDNISFYRSGSLWSNSAIAFVLDTNFNLYHTNAFATVYTSLAAVVTNKSSVWATAVSNYNVAIGNSDTTVPVIAINNLPIQTNNGNLIIKGSASDNSQIAEVWLSVSMSTNAFQKISAATNWVKSFNMLPRGVYTIQAYAKDAAGNVSAIVQKTIKLTWWSYIGSPNLTGGEVGELSLFETNGGVYLATADSVNHYGTIRKYNGSSWSVIGGGILTNFRVDYLSVGIYSNSIPVVAFSDSSLTNKASVMYFNGTNWKYLGLPGFSSGAAYSVKMKIIQDIIFVAYIDAANGNQVTVMKYLSGSWILVPTAGLGTAFPSQSIAFGSDGYTVYLVYANYANGNKMEVLKYTGSFWEKLGSSPVGSGSDSSPAFCIHKNFPCIAFSSGADGGKLVVYLFNGSIWDMLSGAPVSTVTVGYISLFPVNSHLFVSYNESGTSILRTYTNATWVQYADSIPNSIMNQTIYYNWFFYQAYRGSTTPNDVSVMNYR